MKKLSNCEFKPANRWQQVTVMEWVIEIQPIHSNVCFIQEKKHLNVLISEINH